MKHIIDDTVQHLTGKLSLADVSEEEMNQLTKEYPYFAIPYFLKAKKNNDAAALARTSLFFNNPMWMHYQLQPPQEVALVSKNQPEAPIQPILNKVIQEEMAQTQQSTAIEIPSMENVREILERAQNNHEAAIHNEASPNQETPIYSISDVALSNAAAEEANLAPTLQATEQPIQSVAPIVEEEPTTPIVTEPIITTIEKPSIPTNNSATDIEAIEATDTTTAVTVDVPVVELAETSEAENTATATEDSVEPIESTLPEEKLTAILKEQLEAFKQPVTADMPIPIQTEPYHTIDYFASQGIKAEYDHFQQDKLTSQLRKFTDWLKQMKHLQPTVDDLGTDPELETAIQGIAQTSNQAKEIVTETMAEVLEKQGKHEKAIQLYIKLSFLNPEKSAYFANKIQHLKGI